MKFLTPSLAQWLNGMSYTVNSLLIPIQLCGGKKTKHSRYNVVSRVFLSFSLVLMRFPITVIMESAVFSVILKDDILLISKCYWLVLVLISGISLWQRVLSCFCVLLSLHSPPNGKKGTEWVLPSFLVRKGSTREGCTLWNAHPNSLRCNGQGGRKENEGEKFLEMFLGSLSDSIFAWIASVLDANYWTLERMQ